MDLRKTMLAIENELDEQEGETVFYVAVTPIAGDGGNTWIAFADRYGHAPSFDEEYPELYAEGISVNDAVNNLSKVVGV